MKLVNLYPIGCPVCKCMCGRHMWFTQLDDYNRKEQIECNKCKNIFIRYTSHLRDELVTKPTPEELEKYKKKN